MGSPLLRDAPPHGLRGKRRFARAVTYPVAWPVAPPSSLCSAVDGRAHRASTHSTRTLREVSSSDDLFLSGYSEGSQRRVWIDTPGTTSPAPGPGTASTGHSSPRMSTWASCSCRWCVGQTCTDESHVGESAPQVKPLPLANADFRLDGTLFCRRSKGKANQRSGRSVSPPDIAVHKRRQRAKLLMARSYLWPCICVQKSRYHVNRRP